MAWSDLYNYRNKNKEYKRLKQQKMSSNYEPVVIVQDKSGEWYFIPKV